MLTKEEYEYLSQYSKQISQAYYHNYVTGAPSRKDLEQMNEIASNHNLKDESFNPGCGKCQLNLLKRIGKLFYAYIPEPETKPSLPETEEQPKKKNKETKPKSNETKKKSGNSTKRSTAGTKTS